MEIDDWGIYTEYQNANRERIEVPESTRRTLRLALGASEEDNTTPPSNPVHIVESDRLETWAGTGNLKLEEGAEIRVDGHLPRDLPLGYHHFSPADGSASQWIIHTPGVCPLPTSGWGWACQLYATCSQRSWGLGDLTDLQVLARWSRKVGASIIQINPLHANPPTLPQQDSPYFPTTRRYRNLLYLDIEAVPGAATAEIEPFIARGRALNDSSLIDRTAVFELKLAALEKIWSVVRDTQPDGQLHPQDQSLRDFAAYSVIAESHGPDWRRWPEPLRSPSADAVRAFLDTRRDRLRFHQWIQWLLDRQLAAASEDICIMQDLPIGFDPGGFDAWEWQDILAKDVAIGAPPDIYNMSGQNWGLPPWNVWKLREAGYGPFIETIRAALRHAGGLRIDHGLGLFRQFWIPSGCEPVEGGFVRFPHEELLAIIALESQRASAFIVVEDLGTTVPMMAQEFAARQMLSTRVLWFEDDPPPTYPELSMATITTHDLPTVVGLWTGDDFRRQEALGMNPPREASEQIRGKIAKLADLGNDAPLPEVVLKIHALLADAGSILKLVTLDDALMASQRPNMPATTAPGNWRTPLPASLEEIFELKMPNQIAHLMSHALEDNPPQAADDATQRP